MYAKLAWAGVSHSRETAVKLFGARGTRQADRRGVRAPPFMCRNHKVARGVKLLFVVFPGELERLKGCRVHQRRALQVSQMRWIFLGSSAQFSRVERNVRT